MGIALGAVLLKLYPHTPLATQSSLQVGCSFDPFEGGWSFEGGRSYMTLRYACSYVTIYNDLLTLQQVNISYSYSTVPGIHANKQTDSKV